MTPDEIATRAAESREFARVCYAFLDAKGAERVDHAKTIWRMIRQSPRLRHGFDDHTIEWADVAAHPEGGWLHPDRLLLAEDIARLRARAERQGIRSTVAICDRASEGDRASIGDVRMILNYVEQGWGRVERVAKLSPRPVSPDVGSNQRSSYRLEIGASGSQYVVKTYLLR